MKLSFFSLQIYLFVIVF